MRLCDRTYSLKGDFGTITQKGICTPAEAAHIRECTSRLYNRIIVEQNIWPRGLRMAADLAACNVEDVDRVRNGRLSGDGSRSEPAAQFDALH